MDESILRNLDTQHRRLAEIEAGADRLLAGEDGVRLPAVPPAPLAYADLTVANDALRADRGWATIDLDAALTPALRAEFAAWQARQRLPWTLEDVAVVALAGVVGVGATWFDSTIDHAVRDGLNGLRKTEPIKRWEKSSSQLALDHRVPGSSPWTHREDSGGGHDLLRPFEALHMIREGEFRGIAWLAGERVPIRATGHSPLAPRYRQVENLGEALTVWGKHLVADVITPTSLPLPGWTLLYELPSEQLSRFAVDTYRHGTNFRSGMLNTLPALTSEIIVRTHVHGRAMLARGTAVLGPAEEALRTELLLAAHAIVGAASLGKALTRSIALPASVAPPATAAMVFRHVNWPVLMRAATLSVQVAADRRARQAVDAATWDDLLLEVAGPWQLDAAREVDDSLVDAES